MSEIEFAVIHDEDRITIQSALKLQELVKKNIKDQEDNCDSDMELLRSLVEQSEK